MNMRGMPFARVLLAALPLSALLLSALPLGGCSGRSFIGKSVAIDGLVPISTPKGPELIYTGPLQVDIENQLGSVEVRVDPKLSAPVIRSAVYVDRAQKFTPGWVVARLVEVENEPAALQVVATSPEGTKLPVRLIVSVPKIYGLRVSNNNGTVRATNIVGSVEIFNGMATMRGGDVWVELAQPATSEVRVRTTQGDAFVTAPAGSAGNISVRGELGAAIDDFTGKLRQAQRDRFGTSGVLGDLDVSHEVRADNGKATFRVLKEEPVAKKAE